jgi:SAM-dependent methyltransferase
MSGHAQVVNPYVGEAVAARYAWARPQLHDQVLALVGKRLPAPERAIDVGCGTGSSTEPLTSFARVVVGVDASEEMLAARPGGGRAHYVRAVAERLPFRDHAFDLATVASAIHWFDPEALHEIGRVLETSASLVVYDIRFRAEMLGEAAFSMWMSDECGPRYGAVTKNTFSGADFARIGLDLAWEADLGLDVPMTLDALVAYLMTHSERIVAIREGLETEAEQEAFFLDALRPFFSDADERQLGFRVGVGVFSR